MKNKYTLLLLLLGFAQALPIAAHAKSALDRVKSKDTAISDWLAQDFAENKGRPGAQTLAETAMSGIEFIVGGRKVFLRPGAPPVSIGGKMVRMGRTLLGWTIIVDGTARLLISWNGQDATISPLLTVAATHLLGIQDPGLDEGREPWLSADYYSRADGYYGFAGLIEAVAGGVLWVSGHEGKYAKRTLKLLGPAVLVDGALRMGASFTNQKAALLPIADYMVRKVKADPTLNALVREKSDAQSSEKAD